MNSCGSWEHFVRTFLRYDDLGISLDCSCVPMSDAFLAGMASRCRQAYDHMEELERGNPVNISQERQVGHYWLRDSSLAPDEDTRKYIDGSIEKIKVFAAGIHHGKRFTHLLLIGIGGSALGPQLMADALWTAENKLEIAFLDNTDPDGFDRVLVRLPLERTLVLVISKGGGTVETINGMAETEAAYARASLVFPRHAVAVTGEGSKLEQYATENEWLEQFSIAEWMGGRTSVTGVVGLLPMALLGLEIDEFLRGAAMMDAHTRQRETERNAAMRLALAWHFETEGHGKKDMVIIPYKDRLALLAKYLQQLIMESLGKEKNLSGDPVYQGLTVYGNKGSTDQHAYVQQLRDGLPNFFVTFIEVRQSRENTVPGTIKEFPSPGDHLQGFLRGTRRALFKAGRSSVTISLPAVNARALGALIALYERAVGFYAPLIDVNAYDQPGVAAGKRAAKFFVDILSECRGQLRRAPGTWVTAEAIAPMITLPEGEEVDCESVYHALTHLAANDPGFYADRGPAPDADRFRYQADQP